MIIFCFLTFIRFLFLFIKEFFFLRQLFFLDLSVLFLVSIFSLVLFLIIINLFNFSGYLETLFYKICFFLVLFFLIFCFSSTNSFSFFVYLENCVIFIILLIFWFSKDLDKISSTLFIFFINIFPSILFLYFCSDWRANLRVSYFFLLESVSIFCFFCFLGLLLRKLPLFLFHFWLTKVHVRASGCGSIILARIMLKIGSIGIYKFYHFFSKISMFFNGLFFFFVSWSIILLLLIIVRFFDLKYLVACSSVVHMSPIFCLCLMGDSFSIFGSILIIVGHGLISYFIFYIVTILYENTYHRSIDFNKTLSSTSKLTFIFLFFFFLINLGFPPFTRFLRELIFLRSFFLFDFYPFLTFLFSLILRGIFFFFVLSKSLFGKKNFVENCIVRISNFFYSYLYLFLFVIIPFFFY